MTERLTRQEIVDISKSFCHTTFSRFIGKTISIRILNEMFEYKTIEEKIGFSISIIDKIIKNKKFYCKNRFHWDDPDAEDWEKRIEEVKIKNVHKVYFSIDAMLIIDWQYGDEPIVYDYPYDGYGKWWSLTREELEKC